MEATRICKKCLLREEPPENRIDLEKYLSVIAKEDRVSESEYEYRLNVCKECDHLISATCNACGCYVEFRAAGIRSRCPKKKWYFFYK